MPRMKMTVIDAPAPNSRTVFAPTFVGPVIRGGGNNTYICGGCGTPLLEKVNYKQVQDAVVKCGKCGKHNEIARAHHAH